MLSRSTVSLLGAALVVLILLAAVLGPTLTPYGVADMQVKERLQRPNPTHLLGTDQFGRDILSRMLSGARISLFVGVAGTGMAALLGTLIGLIAGYGGGWWDEVLMRLMDILMAFPAIVLTIALIAILGTGFFNVIIIIGVIFIPQFARVIRSSVLSVKEMDFITAAHSIGQMDLIILFRHILPNCVTIIVVLASILTATAISVEAALSFLGLGIQPPMPSWGGMLSEGRAYIQDAPWMVVFPGLAISLTILGFNLLGDGLRDMTDPKIRSMVPR